jgi:hypothetical protein
MATDDWAPSECTLPTAERPLRLAEFDAFFANVRDVRRSQPRQLDLVIPSAAETAGRDLADRESACCSFFSFTFTSHDGDVVMEIGVPTEYVNVLDALEERARTAARPTPTPDQ